ncbi:hypothetical protein EMCRGX_G023466 [Ephydatia muelleri]
MRRASLGVMLIEQGPTTNDDISDIMIDCFKVCYLCSGLHHLSSSCPDDLCQYCLASRHRGKVCSEIWRQCHNTTVSSSTILSTNSTTTITTSIITTTTSVIITTTTSTIITITATIITITTSIITTTTSIIITTTTSIITTITTTIIVITTSIITTTTSIIITMTKRNMF